ncbi:MAG TPA: TIGR02206 family membrane protein [Terracidiphilus sp.]|nr:TIGR02206 family membrane protein [Terracidiphilus sp.]
MTTNFRLFGPAHLAILGAVPLFAAVLALVQRRLPAGTKWLRVALGVMLLADSAFWYAYLAITRQPIFPDQLPFELCDMTLYLTAMALLSLNAAAFDVAYYWALAGTTMALLTPNIAVRFPSLATVQFFVYHGLAVSGVLYLLWSGQARPRPGSVGRAMIAVNILAAFDGIFDRLFNADYMYLRAKPEHASLLSFLGPWPWYIAATEAVALALFLLLYWPFRRSRQTGAQAR